VTEVAEAAAAESEVVIVEMTVVMIAGTAATRATGGMTGTVATGGMTVTGGMTGTVGTTGTGGTGTTGTGGTEIAGIVRERIVPKAEIVIETGTGTKVEKMTRTEMMSLRLKPQRLRPCHSCNGISNSNLKMNSREGRINKENLSFSCKENLRRMWLRSKSV